MLTFLETERLLLRQFTSEMPNYSWNWTAIHAWVY